MSWVYFIARKVLAKDELMCAECVCVCVCDLYFTCTRSIQCTAEDVETRSWLHTSHLLCPSKERFSDQIVFKSELN